jgi:hypothetical protein
MCDDHEALAAINKEWWIGLDNSIDYSATIPAEAMGYVLREREAYGVDCGDDVGGGLDLCISPHVGLCCRRVRLRRRSTTSWSE